MATQSSFKRWISVPDRSRFIVTTAADPPNVRIDITIEEDGNTIQWTTDDLLNKTKRLTVRTPRRYAMTVDIVFAGSKTTLEFDARIEKPDGSPHGKPFRFTATKPPNAHHADISIITKGEAA